jgi:hypothetical protein
MTNSERQRRFRERHPGYYQRLHARKRAALQASAKARRTAMIAEQATQREPLLLPAPAVTIEIPGINGIPTNTAVAEMVAVRGD